MRINIEFKVPDMACDICADKISKAIRAIATDGEITADPQTKLVTVKTAQESAQIFDAVTKAGYTVQW